jgi:hypothetical protein
MGVRGGANLLNYTWMKLAEMLSESRLTVSCWHLPFLFFRHRHTWHTHHSIRYGLQAM